MESPERKQPNNVTVLVSITFVGEGQEPLVAVKTRVDGQEVKLPLAVFLGEGEDPLFVRSNFYNPIIGASFARAFQEAATREAVGIIEAAGRAISMAQQTPDGPQNTVASPSETPSA